MRLLNPNRDAPCSNCSWRPALTFPPTTQPLRFGLRHGGGRFIGMRGRKGTLNQNCRFCPQRDDSLACNIAPPTAMRLRPFQQKFVSGGDGSGDRHRRTLVGAGER